MKKLFSFVLLFVIALSLSACAPETQEVDYHEKKEVEGSYTLEQLLLLTHEEFVGIENSYIRISFPVKDLSYSSSFLRIISYSNYEIVDEVAVPDAADRRINIVTHTTTPFYEDSTKLNDTVIVEGRVTVWFQLVEQTIRFIELKPAFIIN